MKRVLTLLMLSIFLIATIGLEVKAHYCDGVLMQVSVNGLDINTPAGRGMVGCTDGDGCSSCKSIHQSYKIHAQYGVGQVVLVEPAQSLHDWFHGDLPSVDIIGNIIPLPVVANLEATPIAYQPRSHPWRALPQGGLRAPPVA